MTLFKMVEKERNIFGTQFTGYSVTSRYHDLPREEIYRLRLYLSDKEKVNVQDKGEIVGMWITSDYNSERTKRIYSIDDARKAVADIDDGRWSGKDRHPVWYQEIELK